MKFTNFIFTIILNGLLLIVSLGADGRVVSVPTVVRQAVPAVQNSPLAAAPIPCMSAEQQTELLLIALLCGFCFLLLLTFSPLSEFAYQLARQVQNNGEIFE